MLSTILQVPLNLQPGSIEILASVTSPVTVAVAFNERSSVTVNLPSTNPSISAFLQVISPLILPVSPIITLPFVDKFPVKTPLMRISPLETISPVIEVPAPNKLIAVESNYSVTFAISIIF